MKLTSLCVQRKNFEGNMLRCRDVIGVLTNLRGKEKLLVGEDVRESARGGLSRRALCECMRANVSVYSASKGFCPQKRDAHLAPFEDVLLQRLSSPARPKCVRRD